MHSSSERLPLAVEGEQVQKPTAKLYMGTESIFEVSILLPQSSRDPLEEREARLQRTAGENGLLNELSCAHMGS